MFIKDNVLNNEQKHRIEARAAAVPAATPTIVDSGFSEVELNHIKSKVYEAFPTQSNAPLFKTWIDNLFMDPQKSGLDLSEFNRILSVYRTSHRTRDILADIIEGIRKTDFNTPSNQKVMTDNIGKIMSGEWNNFDVLNHFNVVSGQPAGVMGPLNFYLNTQITKPLSTDAEVINSIIKDAIDAELKRYGIIGGLANTKYTLLLKNYLTSSDFTDDFRNIIDNAFSTSEHLDSTLTHFVKLDSLKASLVLEIKNELTLPNVKTHLAGNFFSVLKSMLFSELEQILTNAVSSITKEEAELLNKKVKLTLDEVQTLLPGSKAIFDKYPHTFDHAIFTAKYDDSHSHIILNAHFVYASTLLQAPLFLVGNEPHILINDERAAVDIANEKLQELLVYMHNRDITDGNLLSDIDAVIDADTASTWADGSFHKISLTEFNTLTRANLDENKWIDAVKPKSFSYEIQVRVNQQTYRLEYKFILEDKSASADEFKRKEITITDSQVTTKFHFMYEKIQLELQRLESTPINSHNLLLIGDSSPAVTSEREVAPWFVEKINIIKNEIRGTLIKSFKNLYPTSVDDNRFVIRAYVENFDPSDEIMTLRFSITDSAINLPSGGHPTVEQTYRLKVNHVNNFESTIINRALIDNFELLTGKEGSIFDSDNNPGTTDAPVPGARETWDDAAAKLSDMLIMTGRIPGYDFTSFLDLYNYFKAANVQITWDAKVELDKSGNTQLHGISFHYSVNYFTNIFGSAENKAEKKFDHFQVVERLSASDEYKTSAIESINNEKERVTQIVKLYGENADQLVQQAQTIAQTGIDRINSKGSLSEREVDEIKKITLSHLRALVSADGATISQPWFKKLMELFNHNIPPNILQSIIKNPQFFKSLIDSGASLDSIKMLANHKKLMQELSHLNPNTISNVMDRMKQMEDNYKYTYLGLGAGLGAAGVLSGGLAVSSIRANKKLKQINNKQMKMRGTKVVSAIATLVSLSTLASSAVFMILFFVNKGGF